MDVCQCSERKKRTNLPWAHGASLALLHPFSAVAKCSAQRYNSSVIKHFNHMGRQSFCETGNKSGIRPDHAPRLARQLRQLNDAANPREMDCPPSALNEDLHRSETGTAVCPFGKLV